MTESSKLVHKLCIANVTGTGSTIVRLKGKEGRSTRSGFDLASFSSLSSSQSL